ncbi:MAG: hypothetical protein K8J31_03575 [Anaerolineae bacterium]|nr:hypothetical protein [Anaerolineae bacterium]
MQSRLEQTRISQLTSTYSPDEPPRLPLDFGDYLSILWRLDKHANHPGKVKYYRQCVQALATALNFQNRSIYRLVEITPPGQLYRQLPNAPYRGTHHLIDAHDRKAAISQLADLRNDVLKIGTYQDQWPVSWPGSGIVDTDLRERVFAVLFTALQGQFGSFGRLLLVVDIVLSDLLLGFQQEAREVKLERLIQEFRYPDPTDNQVRWMYYGDEE